MCTQHAHTSRTHITHTHHAHLGLDPHKASKVSGYTLEQGVGVLHDVYPYPQIANDMMRLYLNASRQHIPPLFGAGPPR